MTLKKMWRKFLCWIEYCEVTRPIPGGVGVPIQCIHCSRIFGWVTWAYPGKKYFNPNGLEYSYMRRKYE